MDSQLTCFLTSFLIIFCLLVSGASDTKKLNKEGCNKTIRTTRLVRSPRLTTANRGKAVTCTFHLLKHGVGDSVFELNFKTFHVGSPLNATRCSNAHMQIIDHQSRVNTSGYFCGKLQHRKTFLAETDHITIVFHSTTYTRQTYFRFQTSVLPKLLVLERHKSLVLDNPGQIVEGTYCDRRYVSCQGYCDITSPRFPGFYPRNATCLYSVVFNETQNSNVVVGGHFHDNFDVWAGPWSTSRCSSNYCSSNQISTTCPYDYIQIFDVLATGERSMIQKFCGRGHLPRIVSRGNSIQIEFTSAVAGSIANEGFHLLVGLEKRQEDNFEGEESLESCHRVYNSSKATQGQFQNLKHWYPPGTRCSYRFIGEPDRHKVFLQFVNFNAHREESCRSKLTLYDAFGPDGNAIRGVYCGRHQPNESFLSTAEMFYVEFDSKLGSYDGANFEYKALYTFVDTFTSGRLIPETVCDEVFDSEKGARSGYFDFFQNRLRLRRRHVNCVFKFQGRLTEKVKITFDLIKLNPQRQCNAQERQICSQEFRSLTFDSVIIVNPRDATNDCLCEPVYLPHTVTSTDSSIEIRVYLHNIPTLSYRDYDSYSVKGRYEFLQVGCGKNHLVGSQGELNFPNLAQELLPEHVHCRWTIEVTPKMKILLKIHQLHLFGDCSNNYLKIYLLRDNERTSFAKPKEILCRDNIKQEVLLLWNDVAGAEEPNKAILELGASSWARIRLLWSELATAPSRNSANENVENVNCDYLCKGGRYCIPHHLVCNGVINCPTSNSSWDPLDEGIEACTSVSVIMQWVLLTFCTTFAVTLIISGTLLFWKKCACCEKKSSARSNPQIL